MNEYALISSVFQSLDELQSYIIVERSFESNGIGVDSVEENLEGNLHMVCSFRASVDLYFVYVFVQILEASCYFMFKMGVVRGTKCWSYNYPSEMNIERRL